MVSKQEIEEQNLTTDDVLDYEFAEPMHEPEWLPEWDEDPDTRPGENTRLEDGCLEWERDGFEVALESHETTHWMASVTIPEWVGQYYPREIDLKCHPLPEHGFIKHVEVPNYTATMAVMVIAENYQPVYEVNKFIDELIEGAESSEEFREEVTEKMEIARENEEEQKRVRPPGWSEDDEELVCPHCKQSAKRAAKRDDGGFDCIHCGESVDDYVEERGED